MAESRPRGLRRGAHSQGFRLYFRVPIHGLRRCGVGPGVPRSTSSLRQGGGPWPTRTSCETGPPRRGPTRGDTRPNSFRRESCQGLPGPTSIRVLQGRGQELGHFTFKLVPCLEFHPSRLFYTLFLFNKKDGSVVTCVVRVGPLTTKKGLWFVKRSSTVDHRKLS